MTKKHKKGENKGLNWHKVVEEGSMMKKKEYSKYENCFHINLMITTQKHPEVKYITKKEEIAQKS